MKQFDSQSLINGLDKTTVDGLAEALLIAVTSLKDDHGRYLIIRFDPDPITNIKHAKSVAAMLLGGAK
jgi:hypothetical protein